MIKRWIKKHIDRWIKREEIIFINGPRQVGKTTLMKYIQGELNTKGHSTVFLNLENPNDLALTEDYDYFLKTVLPKQGKIMVFLDEVQLHSRPSNFLKWLYDEYRDHIKLFVSGSANLEIKAKLQDSLVGRKRTFYLKPFNFKEFLEAKQYKSPKNPITRAKQLKYLLDEYMLYGGLPKVVLENDFNLKRELLEEYTATYINKDIRHMIAENHTLAFNNLMIFLAKIMGNLKNNAEISKELQMNRITLNRYLDLLRHTFIVDFIQPYFGNEITRIKKAAKVYFFDNGVRNSLISNFVSLEKRHDAGALFENTIYFHLLQQYEGNNVFYLQIVSGNELDFVCRTSSAKLHGFEVKYSNFKTPMINKGLMNLIKKIQFDKVYLVNQNLTQMERGINFLSFADFLDKIVK